MLLYNKQVTEEIKREIKKFLETNDNENMTTENLWDLTKAVVIGKFKESYDQARQHIQKERHYFANKGPSSQGYGFSSGHVWM